MSSFSLRLIAIIAMLTDHIACVFVDPSSIAYSVMRSVGRISFPIFCFLIVEGFLHTRILGKYILRLAAFALISEIPYDLAFHNSVLEFVRGQNVFATLLLGLLAISAAGKGGKWLLAQFNATQKLSGNIFWQSVVALPALALCCWLAKILDTDYGWAGVAIIYVFYVFHEMRSLAMIAFGVLNTVGWCIGTYAMNDASYILGGSMYYFNRSLQWYALCGAFPITFYNGMPGERRYKYLFYAFYPAHLLIIWLLSLVLK